MYLLPLQNNLFTWYGILFLHYGPFKGGVFRFRLQLHASYPQIKPLVYFTPQLFHPRIHPESGELDLSGLLPEWKPNVTLIWHLLTAIKKAFMVMDESIQSKSIMNSEALKV